MKRLLIGSTALVGLTISSCTLSILASALPGDLIRQSVDCPANHQVKARNFQVISTQRWSQGVVALYSALCPGKDHRDPMQKIFGYKIFKRNGIGWQLGGHDSYPNSTAKPEKDRLLEYNISQSGSSQPNISQPNINKSPSLHQPRQSSRRTKDTTQEKRYIVLYGQVLQPKVAVVEATFDNGYILRDRISNGVFALIAPNATGVCELRALGSDNQILSQENVAMPKQLVGAKQTQRCLPVSHQL